MAPLSITNRFSLLDVEELPDEPVISHKDSSSNTVSISHTEEASPLERGSPSAVLNSSNNKHIKILKKSRAKTQKAKIPERLKIHINHPRALPPKRQTNEAAGYDLYSAEDLVIPSKSRSLVDTGLCMEMLEGVYGRIAPRSGLSMKGIDVGAGVIDRDYTGRVKVLLINNSDKDFHVEYSARVAQLILECNKLPEIDIVTTIRDTVRGSGGFGSTDTVLRGNNIVVKGQGRGRQLTIPVTIEVPESGKLVDVLALIDSGSTGCCISQDFATKNGLKQVAFEKSIAVFNADGTHNAGGAITHYTSVSMAVGKHKETSEFLITTLSSAIDIYLGHDWLTLHNPSIDWKKKTVTFNNCPSSCQTMLANMVTDEDRVFMMDSNAYLRTLEEREEIIRATATDIAIAEGKYKKKTFEEVVPKDYWEFKDVFEEDVFNLLPERKPWDHAIELLPGAKPYCGKIYAMTRDEQVALDKFLQENIKTGRIRPSKSPWGAPFFFVKKKDGKLRPVQDYRKLNEMTKKNRYPLPLIADLLNKMKKAKYFSKLDIHWGYNNIRMADGDEEKAAFITNCGLYEPLVMFFGLTNSPTTFQMMMNDIFHNLILEGKVIVYLDDILIFSEDLDDHKKTVKMVLTLLRQHKLTCKPEKCEFETSETEYLGHIISHGSIRMDPGKVKGVTEWPAPKSKNELQQFLGFTNFYRRFIKDFSKIAKPLNQLTGNVDFIWAHEQQTAFQLLKDTITSAPILAVPLDDELFRVECDASKFAIGATLSQKQDDHWRTIAFLSRSLTPAE